jgi:integrase
MLKLAQTGTNRNTSLYLWSIFGQAALTMSGTVRHAKLENATARARLKRGRQPHWQAIVSRAHLGYQRKSGAPQGRWILRRYTGGNAYASEELGLADDDPRKKEDGVSILSFEQAKAKAIALLNASAEGKPHGRMTVRRAVANYLAFLKEQGRSIGDTERRAVAHILPKLGDMEVAALTSAQIRKWLSALAAAPAFVRTRTGEPQKYKPASDDPETVRRRRSSANRVLTILKASLNHAYDERHVISNDAWGRRVKPFRNVEVARIRYLTVEEAKRLLNGCDPDFRPLVRAALETGARYSEIARLEVQDFNRATGTLNIRKSKSGKSRHVILTDEGATFFQQVCAGRAGDDLIFKRADGNPWRASHQGRPIKEANARAQLNPPITFHGLRHTWASLAVMAGVPIAIVARNLGHEGTNTTEKHYGHLARSYITDAIRAGAPRFGLSQK